MLTDNVVTVKSNTLRNALIDSATHFQKPVVKRDFVKEARENKNK